MTTTAPLPETHVMGTYGRQNVVFERGEGPWVWSTSGDKYLDFASGVAAARARRPGRAAR
jgi:acetylornithine/N-succinyldiaminopimelate aminotransferase